MSRYCDGDDDVGGSVVLVPEPPPTFLLLRVFAAWRVNPKRGVGDEEALAFGVNRSKVLPDVIGCAAVPSGGWISPAAPSSAIVTRVGIALAGRLFYNVLLDAMPIQSRNTLVRLTAAPVDCRRFLCWLSFLHHQVSIGARPGPAGSRLESEAELPLHG